MRPSYPYLTLRNLSSSSFREHHVWDYDIIVAGGGVVGAAITAKLLKTLQGSLRIAIVDTKPPSVLSHCLEKVKPDARVYALSPSSVSLLDDIGAWKYINERSKKFTNMQVWESHGSGMIQFPSKGKLSQELGYIVEDATIQAGIFKSIEDSGHKIDSFFGYSISDVNMPSISSLYSTGPVTVTLSNTKDSSANKSLSTRLLIGADGATSAVRRLSGLSTCGWTYGQDAIIATVKVDCDHSTAWQVYLPTGPLALLPLWDGYSSIVWSMPTAQARSFLKLESLEYGLGPDWLPASYRMVRREIVSLVDTMKDISNLMEGSIRCPPKILSIESDRFNFPLQLQQAKSYVSPRIALIGDAAHSIHPQAGQGLNIGLNDVKVLVDTITKGLSSGTDIGSFDLLQEYHHKQFLHNSIMLLSVDSIDRIFKSKSNIVQKLRALGMLGFHGNPFVKDQIGRFFN
eukprot:gene8757-18115_t